MISLGYFSAWTAWSLLCSARSLLHLLSLQLAIILLIIETILHVGLGTVGSLDVCRLGRYWFLLMLLLLLVHEILELLV